MARKESAGTVLVRHVGATRELEILLVHPSGAYNRRAPWSIPKGLPDDGETLRDAARRETREETGVVAGELIEIGFVDYTKSRKRVHAFAGLAPPEAAPTCASWEVDRAQFVRMSRALELVHPDQRALLGRAAAALLRRVGE